MEVFNAELEAIGVTLRKFIPRVGALRAHRVRTVAVSSELHATITQTAHLNPGPREQLKGVINKHTWALRTN